MSRHKEEINPMSAERIEKCRKALRYSRVKLAELAGTTDQTIYCLEKGKRGLTSYMAESLGSALKVSPDYLRCKSDIKNSEHEKMVQFERQQSAFDNDILFFKFLMSYGIRIKNEGFDRYTITFSGSGSDTFYITSFHIKLIMDMFNDFINNTLLTVCRGFDKEIYTKLNEMQFLHDLNYDIVEENNFRFAEVLRSWQLSNDDI